MTVASQYISGKKGPNLSGCLIASNVLDGLCFVFQLSIIIAIFASGTLWQVHWGKCQRVCSTKPILAPQRGAR